MSLVCLTIQIQTLGPDQGIATSPVVENEHENGSANTIRMVSMTYPDGRQLDYDYGTSGSESDLLDRVVTIEDGAPHLHVSPLALLVRTAGVTNFSQVSRTQREQGVWG